MSLNGIVQKIAWVDLNKREVKIEEPDDDIYINYLGGYGLGAYPAASEGGCSRS